MEEIKVREYVRTRGIIGKLVRIEYDKIDTSLKWYVLDKGNYEITYVNKPYIEKHSSNIIDLIEVGDILQINKEKYEVVYDRSYNKLGLLIPNREKLGIRHCSLQYIFSKQGISEFKNIRVVTKEQFSNIEYRLEN